MLVLVNEHGDIINEGDDLTDPETKKIGKYTGWMPPHPRNLHGLVFIQFENKKWEDSFLPPNLKCKLIDI